MDWLRALDLSVFHFINWTLSNPVFDVLMPFFSGNPLFIPLAVITAAIVIWRGKTKGLLFVILLAAAVGFTDGVVCNSTKRAVARPRPWATVENVHLLVGRGGSGSMPSSHAANWFAATAVAFLFHRRSWRVMLPLAVTVSFSRVYNGAHFPSDVIVGAILGSGSGVAVVVALEKLWRQIGPRWFPIWHRRLPSLLAQLALKP